MLLMSTSAVSQGHIIWNWLLSIYLLLTQGHKVCIREMGTKDVAAESVL